MNMHYKNQPMVKAALDESSCNMKNLLHKRDEILQMLSCQLFRNQQYVNQLLFPITNQSTASRSNGSNSNQGNRSSVKSHESESVLIIKNEEIQQEEVSEGVHQQFFLGQKVSNPQRNDTKNIPKNYGKAILSFVQKSPLSRKLATEMGISYSDLMINVRRFKKRVNSIETLRKMWGSENLDHKIKKCIRILSYHFMRKHCLQYIFHSKVRNYGTHIKYRTKLIQGIQNPKQFNHIKDY